MALARPRDLLILDEPEQRLDPAARRRLADLLVAEKAAPPPYCSPPTSWTGL